MSTTPGSVVYKILRKSDGLFSKGGTWPWPYDDCVVAIYSTAIALSLEPIEKP